MMTENLLYAIEQALYNQHQIDNGDILKCGHCGIPKAFDEICINHGVCDLCLENWLDEDKMMCQHGFETEDDCRKRLDGESVIDILKEMEHYSIHAVSNESEKTLIGSYVSRIREALKRKGFDNV